MAQSLRNNSGFSSVLLLSIAFLVSSLSYLFFSRSVATASELGNLFEERAYAELYASELVEFFRSLDSMAMNRYLNENQIPICDSINLITNQDPEAPQYVNQDIFASLAAGSFSFKPAQKARVPERYYQVRVIDVGTLSYNLSLCGEKAPIELSPTQRFIVNVGVAWNKEHVTLTTLIPN